jgi:hypothetical protein
MTKPRRVSAPTQVRWALKLISADVQRPMEHPEDIDVAILLYEIGDTVMSIKKNSYLARRRTIAITNLRKIDQKLSLLVDTPNCLRCSERIVLCDVLENIFEPTLGFISPDYLCHDRMR